MLKPVPIGFWESERQCTWPQEVIVRLDERVLLKHITIVSKYDRSIPELEVLIGDGISGHF